MARIVRKKITRKRKDSKAKKVPIVENKDVGLTVEQMGQRLGEIKSIIKSLDTEGKAIQEELLAEPVVVERFKTPYGVLSLRKRANWTVDDKEEVIDYIGQKVYNDKTAISKTGIVEAVGELGLSELEDSGAIIHEKDSQFYQLTAPKKK